MFGLGRRRNALDSALAEMLKGYKGVIIHCEEVLEELEARTRFDVAHWLDKVQRSYSEDIVLRAFDRLYDDRADLVDWRKGTTKVPIIWNPTRQLQEMRFSWLTTLVVYVQCKSDVHLAMKVDKWIRSDSLDLCLPHNLNGRIWIRSGDVTVNGKHIKIELTHYANALRLADAQQLCRIFALCEAAYNGLPDFDIPWQQFKSASMHNNDRFWRNFPWQKLKGLHKHGAGEHYGRPWGG